MFKSLMLMGYTRGIMDVAWQHKANSVLRDILHKWQRAIVLNNGVVIRRMRRKSRMVPQ